MIVITPAGERHADAIWTMLQQIAREGDSYALPADLTREDALAYWFARGNDVFVAIERSREDEDGDIVGTFYLRANQRGPGAHVANCGYITAPARRGRGVGRLMAERSLDLARARGFLAMQFNAVVSTNESAVRLWQRLGFAIVGRVPGAFHHPTRGYVDIFVMHRTL